jgi:general secretion pathway protein K
MKDMMKTLKNEKGIALLITLFAIMIMVFLAVEVSYNTAVELRVSAAQVDRLKAYYLAKAGVELSVLRINAYKTVLAKFGQQLGASKSELDMIWSFPFAWPPLLPDGASDFDKEQVKSAIKTSSIEGTFNATITAESGKININDMGSTNQALATATYNQIYALIQDRMNAEDDWARNHENLRPQEIVNNISDWITEGNQSKSGGDKTAPYVNSSPTIKPAYRSLKTIEELHQIAGVTDDVYNVIAPYVTVYGEKGVNVNYASAYVLQSIDKQMTADIAKAMITRRDDQTKGPFKDYADLQQFLQTQGINVKTFNQAPVINLLFDTVASFRIRSTGVYGKSQREIVAIAYDFDTVKAELSKLLAQTAASATPPPGQGQSYTAGTPTPSPTASGTATTAPVSGAPPILVFWEEH